MDDDDEADSRAARVDPRRVKTAAGRRMIALHAILIQAGFIAFVQERHGRSPKQLFRELKPDQHGFWSSAITKRLNLIIRSKLKITNPRYTAIEACKAAGVPEEVRMKFGHQLNGVHGIYGNPWVSPYESALIDTVRFEGCFGRLSP